MNTANSMDFMAPEVLDEIFSIDSETIRQEKLNELRQVAKERKLLTEFNAVIKARRADIKAEREREKRRRTMNLTDFEGLEEHGYKNLFCGAWNADEHGITMTEYGKNIEMTACSHPILPVQILKNIQTGREKVVLAFKKNHRWEFPVFKREILASANRIVDLSAVGVDVTSESARALVRYLADVGACNMDDIEVKESSSKFGFVRGRFIPYDANGIKFDADGDLPELAGALAECGDRETWFEHIRAIRATKSFPALVMMAASFGSILLCKIGALPFVVDLWGDTEAGKSVCEMVACSIWADPNNSKYIGDFKATEVSLEVKAAALNHLPLILDDTAKVSKRIRENFEGFIYDMTSGKGKSRSNKSLGVQSENYWQLAILTTGEAPINSYVNQGGAVNRIIEVHAVKSIFEDPHKTSEIVRHNYGFAGREFVRIVQEQEDDALKEEYNRILADLQKRAAKATQKQMMSLAAVLLADKLTSEKLFRDGISISPAESIDVLTDPEEVSANERCYKFLTDEIMMNASRFERDTPGEKWGQLDETIAYLFPAVLEQLCAKGGYSVKSFLDFADKHGIIEQGRDGRRQKVKKIDGRSVRVYFFHLPDVREPEEKSAASEAFIQVDDADVNLPFD